MKKHLTLIFVALVVLAAMTFAIKSADKVEAPVNNTEQNTLPSDDTPAETPVNTGNTGSSGSNPGSSNNGPCYVGGCSSQICSDEPGVASTCEYREEYACYSTAKCERQVSGQCGWTPTPELSMCLNSSIQ